MGPRGALWLMWIVTEVISATYICICLVTFKNIQWLQYNVAMVNNAANQSLVTCLLSATILSVLVLIVFFATSLFILLKKAAFHEGLTGFGFGCLISGSFYLAFFMVLVGLVMNSATGAIKYYERATAWTRLDTSVYWATFSFAFILSFLYMLLCIVFFIFKGYFKKQQPAGHHVTHSTKPEASPA
eukprot:jgi/Botrbrau1/18126/Bobra.53_1s0005.1